MKPLAAVIVQLCFRYIRFCNSHIYLGSRYLSPIRCLVNGEQCLPTLYMLSFLDVNILKLPLYARDNPNALTAFD